MSRNHLEVVRQYWASLDRAQESYWANPDVPLNQSLPREGAFDLFQPDADWISVFGPGAFRGVKQLLGGVSDW